MVKIGYVTIDCSDPAALAEFWAELLDVEVAGTWNQYVIIAPSAGVQLAFQGVPEPKTGKNRAHVDLLASDLEAEVERAVRLGATRLAEHHEDGTRWWVMADPEANEFCILQGAS